MAGHDEFAPHGAFLGHAVPGSFFIIWGFWWLISTFWAHFSANRATGFHNRAWYSLPGLDWAPWEPFLKIFGCFIGINGEIWFGQQSFTYMLNDDGRFNMGHLNNWQHAAMYFAFMVSGAVDVAGYYGRLPRNSEQAALGVAFTVEGLLLVFHLKGSPLEVIVHKLLVIDIAALAIVCFMEAVYRKSLVLSLARALLVILQGIWFIQIGYILFRHIPAWDPHYMGGTMMVPVLFCFDILLLVLASLGVYVGMQWATEKWEPLVRRLAPTPAPHDNADYEAVNGSDRFHVEHFEDAIPGIKHLQMASLS